MSQQLEAHKGNIMKFNEWVKEQVAILHSRGEEAHDLLAYLWKTYQKAPDAKFMEYIQNLRNDFITGKSDFTAQELMNLADMMYKPIRSFVVLRARRNSGTQRQDCSVGTSQQT